MSLRMSRWAVTLAAALGVIGGGLAGSDQANADFRTGNTWMTTPRQAVAELHARETYFFGPQTNGHRLAIGYTNCKGDLSRDYTRDSNGHYHHLYCASRLVGMPHLAVRFDFWQVGPKGSVRTTNIVFFSI